MSKNHINMFGGSPLNRLAWLRTSSTFLNEVIEVPAARWILFNAGQPLVGSKSTESGAPNLVFLSTEDVRPFLGPKPYFGQGKDVGDYVPDAGNPNEHPPTEASRQHGPPLVFLGIHERTDGSGNALPTSEFKDPKIAIKKLEGTPYFSMDVADLELSTDQLDEVLKKTVPGNEGQTFSWPDPRSLMSGLDAFNAAVFAAARSLVDWNYRNKFCPGCGTRSYSMWGGWKLACRTLLPWAINTSAKPCPSGKGLHNYTHPRTDGVVIMLTIDETGERVLLGRGKRFPPKFYSALAGFIEPGESFEDAVVREMWEEAGVKVRSMMYHSAQPWPYPASLMVGFYARADSSQVIRTDLDNELADARWFTREEVLAVVENRAGLPQIISQAFSAEGDKPIDLVEAKQDEPPFKVPPATAIAGVLIRDWAYKRISFEGGQKTNLL